MANTELFIGDRMAVSIGNNDELVAVTITCLENGDWCSMKTTAAIATHFMQSSYVKRTTVIDPGDTLDLTIQSYNTYKDVVFYFRNKKLIKEA